LHNFVHSSYFQPDSTVDSVTQAELINRALPLGYDRTGREYWLLDCQCFALLGGLSFHVSSLIEDEPGLLVRDVRIDRWCFIGASKFERFVGLLSSEFPSEIFLWKRIVSKFLGFQGHLSRTTLKLKFSQSQWLNPFRYELWFNGISNLVSDKNNFNDIPRLIRMLELCFARSSEARICVHYAVIFRDIIGADDLSAADMDNMAKRKLAKLRIVDQTLDLSPTNGWLRSDSFERIRELSTTTTATRILSETSLQENVLAALKRSSYRKKNPFCSDIGPNFQSYIKPSAQASFITRRSSALTSTPTTATAAGVTGAAGEADSGGEEEGDSVDYEALEEKYGRARQPGKVSSFTEKAVEQLHFRTGEILRLWESGSKAASGLGVSRSGISLCCTGLKAEAHGFMWKFVDRK
jgi:hypothetical protein